MSLLLVALISVVAVLGLTAGGRKIFYAGRSQFGKLGRHALSKDPVAVYQQRLDDATAKFNENRDKLASAKATLNTMERQKVAYEKNKNELERKLQKLLTTSSDAASSPDAKRLATLVGKARQETAEIESQINEANTYYERCRSQVSEGQRVLQEAKDKGKSYGAKLKMAEATASLAKMRDQFSGNGLEALDSASAEIEEAIDRSRASIEVQSDLDQDNGVADRTLLADAQADDILAEFQKLGTTKVTQLPSNN